MAASSSSSCKSLTSNLIVKAGKPTHSTCKTWPAWRIFESDVRTTVPTRKAERERLRRDRLNEQLLELAGALDPDRPKNDKSTVLADAIQTLKELMADVERLRAEHALLVDESQDLCQEKKELHDERLQLTSKVQRLQNQVCQQMHAMLLWMTADPVNMMGAYTASSSSHGTVDVDAHARPPLSPSQMQIPFFGAQPMPLVPAPMAVHPALQAHYGYTVRGAPYFPYSFNYSNGGPSQAEVPAAQVPQPFEGYPLQAHHSPLMHPVQPVSQAAAYSQAWGSLYPYMMPTIAENQNVFNVEEMSRASAGHNEQHPGSRSVKPCNNEHLADASPHVQTTLQLQSPASLSNAQLLQNQQSFQTPRST